MVTFRDSAEKRWNFQYRQRDSFYVRNQSCGTLARDAQIGQNVQ